MDIDILAALSDEAPRSAAVKPCVIRRWLDSIPDDASGRDDLVATFSTNDQSSEHFRTLSALERIASSLGLQTSQASIGAHRTRRCKCRT